MPVEKRQRFFKERLRHIFRDQHTLGRVAHRRPRALGVIQDVRAHIEVGLGVDIHMAHTLSGTDNGHARLLAHGADEPCPAARDEYVDVLVQMHQLLRALTACILYQTDAVFGQ